VEILGRHPAPLRGWVRITAAHPNGGIRLDEFGRKVLGVSNGDEVEVRYVYSTPVPMGLAT
jgi:hypothetical protein